MLFIIILMRITGWIFARKDGNTDLWLVVSGAVRESDLRRFYKFIRAADCRPYGEIIFLLMIVIIYIYIVIIEFAHKTNLPPATQ